ncbi:LEA type 2 family protein [Chitinophagaceae bacterium MMS25-I14]
MKKILSLLILICTTFFISCSQPKELVYQDVKNFHIKSLGIRESTIGLDMQYYNPNNYALEMKGGDIDVTMNDKYLGKAALDNRITIPKKDTFLIPVALTTDLKSILENSLQVLLNPEVTIRLKGYVKVGKGGIFINVPVDFVTQQKIEIR